MSTNSFIVTGDYIRQFNPCGEGYAYFLRNWPEGGSYQDIMAKCYEDGHDDWALWLEGNTADNEITALSSMEAKARIRFGLPGFVQASIDFIWRRTNPATVEHTEGDSSGPRAQIGSSGPRAQIGSSGPRAQIGSSGPRAQIGSSGPRAQIGSSGPRAQIGSSGDGARIGSSGPRAQIGSSGPRAQIGSSGDGARIGSSGPRAQIGSSGFGAQIGSSGPRAQIGSSGFGAQIGSSGDGAQIGSSGDGARINVEGRRSVASTVGHKGRIKGVLGTWITLAEWKRDDEGWYPACVRSAKIDGETLKADTWYQLRDGEFVEVTDE